MLGGSFVFMWTSSLDFILLRAVLKEPMEVGFYSAGIRIPQLIQGLILAPLSTPFTYYFTHPETLHTREQILKLGTKILSFVCAIISLGLFSFGGIVVRMFYGKFYLESIPILQTYSFVFFLFGMFSLFVPFLVAIDKPGEIVQISIVSTIAIALLDYFWLIPKYHSIGPALANIAILVLQNCYALYRLNQHQINIVKQNILMMALVLASVLIEKFFIPFSSILFFIISVLVFQLFNKDEINKIERLLFSKEEKLNTA